MIAGDSMGFKDNMIQKLRMATNDKEDLHKQALRLNKSIKEVEKTLGSSKGKKK